MFIDEATIKVEGGHGGPGKVSFHAMRKGPSGGNGGRGGNVYAVVNNNVTQLKKYSEVTKYKAVDGGPGGKNKRSGLNGPDLELEFPNGTTIIDIDKKDEIELNQDNPRVILCEGGSGGLGNEVMKTSTNRTPRYAGPGFPGQLRHLKIILKLIADYGLIGLPNAGKSSLLNELTSANVKTAAYPFTTLEPNLGVFNNRVIADVPGLIEGASGGKGLGIKFLKHIEKVKLLFHCISVESTDIEKEYQTVINELGQYNISLLDKKSVILLTKIDLVNKKEMERIIKILKKFNNQVIPVSIFDISSLDQLKKILL